MSLSSAAGYVQSVLVVGRFLSVSLLLTRCRTLSVYLSAVRLCLMGDGLEVNAPHSSMSLGLHNMYMPSVVSCTHLLYDHYMLAAAATAASSSRTCPQMST